MQYLENNHSVTEPLAEIGSDVSVLDTEDRNMKFLQAALSLAIVDTLKGEEQDKKKNSFRHNRLKNAEEVMLRICDIYLPEGINSTALNKVWAILDGPVTDVLRKHKDELYAAVVQAAQTTQEA
jgi:hypothetical protein